MTGLAGSVFPNPRASQVLAGQGPDRDALGFHRRLPGYAPSRLVPAPTLAKVLDVGHVWVKDEAGRFGLPSFKILGASWAVYRTLVKKLGGSIEDWHTFTDLKQRFNELQPLTLVAATDGNHGRAVAHMAALLGFTAQILVPSDMAKARIEAIRSEGAGVDVVEGTYDEAVEQAGRLASDRRLVIQDTAWPGYEEVPRWVMDGYSTILWEVADALPDRSILDLVAVQMGVGSLATAVVSHFRRPELTAKPRIVGVEPVSAACVMASAKAGTLVSVPGPMDSIMAGLNCGVPSSLAWPVVSAGIDVFAAIDDEYARKAMVALAGAGVVSGETGAAGLGGLLWLLAGPDASENRRLLKVDRSSRVLVLSTEGATDPAAYERVVGRPPA